MVYLFPSFKVTLCSMLTMLNEMQEGQAAQADVNSHAMDDGVIDSDEKKAIAKAHKRALEARHRYDLLLNVITREE